MTQEPPRPAAPDPWSAPSDASSAPTPPPAIEPPPVAPSGVPPAEWAPPATTKAPSKWRAIIPIVLVIGAIGVVLYVTRDNKEADNLAVGTCFNVPSEETLNTVETKPCTEAHDAEVFHTQQYTGDTSSYPTTSTWDTFIATACDPLFGTYVGTPIDQSTEFTYGWFFPTRDGWDEGGRTITCYVQRIDEAKLSQSVKVAS